MESSVIKIKCPRCGAILAVRMQPGIENKNVTCPVCKESSSFKSYKPVSERKSDDETSYPGKNGEERTIYGNNQEKTEIGLGLNYTLGCLKVSNLSVPTYRLKPGRNVVGRKASASSADFRIPVEESRRMSREHLVVDVKKVPGKGYVHYASLYKKEVNNTFINQDQLDYGDCIILKHGDKINLPDVTLIFEIPDGEGTEL